MQVYYLRTKYLQRQKNKEKLNFLKIFSLAISLT